jgi:tRNA threonylcarbamoyladenosine biosynthesis protein TsaE
MVYNSALVITRSNLLLNKHKTKNAEETKKLGSLLAEKLVCGDIVSLYGGLGAGKTVFTKGIAEGLGVKEEIVSPTFTILKEYEGREKLYHFDLYRIEDEEELEHIGFYEYLGRDGICVIEWPENAENLPECIKVRMTGSGGDERIIEIEGRES